MPLVKRSVRSNYAYSSPHFLEQSKKPGHGLQSINIAATAGSLKQLGLLSEYAADIFDGLMEVASEVNIRISSISRRAEIVLGKLPAVDTVAQNKKRERCTVTVPLADKSTEQILHTQLCVPSTIPGAMKTRYDSAEMRRIPPVNAMDVFCANNELIPMGGSCTHKYSFPNYFIVEWTKKEALLSEQLRKEREIKKTERKLKRERASSKALGQKTAKKGLNWRDQ